MSTSPVAPAASRPVLGAQSKPAASTAGANANVSAGGGGSSSAATAASTPFLIETGSDRARWLKLLVYADYGVGKTYLAGTSADVPAMQSVLMINAESGDLTLDAEDHNFQSIDYVRAKDFKTVARVHEFLKLHCSLRDKYLDAPQNEDALRRLIELEARLKGESPESVAARGPKLYRTVIIDSLTEVEQFCMNQLLGISDATRLDEETAAAEWPEYKRNHNMVQRMIRNFRDLPMHVVMTCGRTYVQDESKKFLYSPAMTGKLSSQVQGFMDMVGFMMAGSGGDDGTITRRLYVQPGARYAAKCRFSRFKNAHIDDPTMTTIFKAIGLSTKA